MSPAERLRARADAIEASARATASDLRAMADEIDRANATPVRDEWIPIRRCGLPPTTARRLARGGALRCARVGRELRVHAGDVASWIESRAAAPASGVCSATEADELDRALARGRRSA